LSRRSLLAKAGRGLMQARQPDPSGERPTLSALGRHHQTVISVRNLLYIVCISL
jgi:hypothetical protein